MATPDRATRPLRGLLPALDASACEALRAFFSEPRWWLLGDGSAVQAAPAAAPSAAFAIDAEGTRLALQIDGPASAGVDDARLRWSDHTGRARILAWSLAHETTLRRLSEWLGVSLLPVLAGDDDAPPADAAPAGLWLRIHVDEPAGDGDAAAATPAVTALHLRLPVQWLHGLARRSQPPYEGEPLPDAGRWRGLVTPLRVLLPVLVPMRDWRALRPGDVIVAGHRGHPPACIARAAGRDWPLAPAAGGWSVHGAPLPTPAFTKEPAMDEKTQADRPHADGQEPDAAPAAADPARSLPVQVEFELGRTEMSVGELADLQPGYVFTLGAVVEGNNVVIRANGRAVGRGELVAVGDTLGVRLLSWS